MLLRFPYGPQVARTPWGQRCSKRELWCLKETTNYEGHAPLRSNLNSNSEADVAKAVAYGKRIKLYPLSKATHPSEAQFVVKPEIALDLRSFDSGFVCFFHAADCFLNVAG
jgi:hypothetical protein